MNFQRKIKGIFETVNSEDKAVAYIATFVHSDNFDVSSTSAKDISKRYDVAEFEDSLSVET